MNVTTGKQVTEELKKLTEKTTPPQDGASDMAHIVLTFDSNRLASALFGQFDENLAYIEQKLGIDLRSKSNQLVLRGEAVTR